MTEARGGRARTVGDLVEVVHALPGRARLRMASAAERPRLRAIEAALRAADGVEEVRANASAHSLTVGYDQSRTTLEALLALEMPSDAAAASDPLSRYPHRARASMVAPASPAAVWRVVSDVEQLAGLLGDRIEVGPARADGDWEVRLSVLGRAITARAQIEAWEPEQRLAVHLYGGIDALVAAELTEVKGGTRIHEAVGYRLGGGVLGNMAGSVLDRRLKGRLERHLEAVAASTARAERTAR